MLSNGYVRDTISGITWVPNNAQFLGEVQNTDDQMPGSYSYREEFSTVQYSNDLRTWTNVTSPAFVSPGYSNWYGSVKVAVGVYDIWDRDCL